MMPDENSVPWTADTSKYALKILKTRRNQHLMNYSTKKELGRYNFRIIEKQDLMGDSEDEEKEPMSAGRVENLLFGN